MNAFLKKKTALLFAIILMIWFFASVNALPPKAETSDADSIRFSKARMVGNVIETGGKSCRVWFEYGKTEELGQKTKWQVKNSPSHFYQTLSGLDAETTYYFRAVVQNSDGIDYGQIKTFTTGEFPLKTTAVNVEKWFNAAFTVSLTCTELAEKCRKTYYRVDNSEWVEGTEISISTEGKHSIEFYSDYADGKNESLQETWAGLDLGKPEKVQQLSAESTGKSVFLEWSASSDAVSGIKEYNVYRNGELVVATKDLNFNDENIELDKNYEYYVVAVDFAGNQSDKSNSVVGFAKKPLPPRKELQIEFVEPSAGTYSPFEQELKEIVIALYVDEEKLNKDSIEAKIFVDGKEQNAVFVLDEETGKYKAILFNPITPGKKKISIKITESDFSGEKTIETDFAPAFGYHIWFLVLGIVIIAIVAIVLFFVFKSGFTGRLMTAKQMPSKQAPIVPPRAGNPFGGIVEKIGKIPVPARKTRHSMPPEIRIGNDFLAIDVPNRIFVDLIDKEGLASPRGVFLSVKSPSTNTTFNVVKNKKMNCAGGGKMIKCYYDIPPMPPMARDAKISILAKGYEFGGLVEKIVRVTTLKKEKTMQEMQKSTERMEKLLEKFQKKIGEKPSSNQPSNTLTTRKPSEAKPTIGKNKKGIQEMKM